MKENATRFNRPSLLVRHKISAKNISSECRNKYEPLSDLKRPSNFGVGVPLGVFEVHPTSRKAITSHFEDPVSKPHVSIKSPWEEKLHLVAIIIYGNFRGGCECVTSRRVIDSNNFTIFP